MSLLFVDRELGYTGWAAFTEQGKKTFNHYPYKVDFTNHEICEVPGQIQDIADKLCPIIPRIKRNNF